MSIRIVVLCCGAAIMWAVTAAGEEDLRKRFGTATHAATQQLAIAVERDHQGNKKGALEAVEMALAVEPNSIFALRLKAQMLRDLGNVTEAIAVYRTAISADRRQEVAQRDATILAMQELGTLLSRLENYEEGNLWLSKAILSDPANTMNRQFISYRNMSMNWKAQQHGMSAFMTAAMARRLNHEAVTKDELRSLGAAVGSHDMANLLYLGDETPHVEARQHRELVREFVDTSMMGEVLQILADPRGRYVIVLSQQEKFYHVVYTDPKLHLKKIAIDMAPTCGCLAGDRLYIGSATPPTMHEVHAETGREIRRFELSQPVDSLAVFPHARRAYFPVDGRIHGINLETGEALATEVPGQMVQAHPGHDAIYSSLRSDQLGFVEKVTIDGVTLPRSGLAADFIDTSTLFRTCVTHDGLIVAGIRDRVARSGRQLCVSPDGNWIAVTGGYGWSQAKRHGADTENVLPIFSATNLDHVQALLTADPRPRGVAFNPATDQVAVVADATVSICHLADGRQAQVLKCKSNGHAAWSGDGAYLCIGRSDAQGVHIFRNPLTATEVERGKNWWSKIIQLPARDDDHAVVSGPLAQFQNFDIKSERDDVVRSFTRALEVVPGRAPADWRSVGRYQRDAQARDKLEKARKNLQEPGGIGVGIFQLEQAHKAHPQNVPLAFYLAEALHQSGQHDRAEKLFKKVVREDSGQSDLALNALVALHELRKEAGDAMGSLYCLSAALEIDRANPTLSPQAIPLLKAYGLQELAQRLAGQTPHQQATPSESIRLGKLPALPHSREEVRVLQTSEIYAATVPATVLIRTPDGSGTGFCVAKPGYILTNAHVVGQEKTVQVYPFDFVDQKPTRLEPISGRVVFRSGDEDLAVVFIQEVPKSMRPLIVASLNAQAGTSVYAIGNPGLDDEILEQTVSQGIVSHAQRQWRGNLYLQHTAGVNPGNSGGPLLNNEGHVVGMVTLKAYLQSVSFAIPVSQIRRAFAEGDHR